MLSNKVLKARSAHRRRSSTRDLDDEFQELSLSSLSRPSTQDSKSSCSRLSSDSGEGSLEDFNYRRNSSPVFWRDGPGRRHTAPIRKVSTPTDDESFLRPNTVHVWGNCSPRCSLSRYAPLPAIGAQKQNLDLYDYHQELDRSVPVRRQCFMGPLDIDSSDGTTDINKNDDIFQVDSNSSINKPVFSLTLTESDTDSDFESQTENIQQSDSEAEDSGSKPRRPIIRSATFTIEKEKPDIHGPFLSIAVRLPDGSRIANRFDCKETLQNVCDLALETIAGPQPEKWSLVTTDIPKRIFKDLTLNLKEAGIDDKTLLYLQERSDSDSD